MPLSEGTTKESRQKNIEREIAAGKDPKQAAAIAYSKQRENITKKRDTSDSLKNLKDWMEKFSKKK